MSNPQTNTPQDGGDELEHQLTTDLTHTLKLVPQSQRELFVYELAKYLAPQFQAREREAERRGYLSAQRERPLTTRQLHLLGEVMQGHFSTYYAYAQQVGISHQAAQQTYAVLAAKGLVPPLTSKPQAGDGEATLPGTIDDYPHGPVYVARSGEGA